MGYTSPVAARNNFKAPDRNRLEHANALKQGLAQAWQAASGRQAAAHSSRNGIYLEFASAPGFELKAKSLEDRAHGIRLLNIREDVGAGEVRSLATVYIPKSKSSYFVKKFDEYASKDTKTGKPQHQPLVASVDEIREALLSGFWTGRPEHFPSDVNRWVEVWISSTHAPEIQAFRNSLAEAGIEEHEDKRILSFPERSVLLVLANKNSLLKLLTLSDLLAELRQPAEPTSFFIELENAEQAEWAVDLVSRCSYNPSSKTSVCILDSGVNAGHPLLKPIVAASDLHTIYPNWSLLDERRHGTYMAGISGYGDLQKALESNHSMSIGHVLESVKIIRQAPDKHRKELWGSITAQAIARAEIQAPDRRRVVCLAVTSTETRERGRPTSWSGELDQLASGVDPAGHRLIIVSCGSIMDSSEWRQYPNSNFTNEVHDPAQAWNVLSVGAYTDKIHLVDKFFSSYSPVAPAGGLSPYSTTSVAWQPKWPIKPEVVFEGGNVAHSPNGSVTDPDELQVLSTFHDITQAHFGPFGATSAAAAEASNFAASLWEAYPELWPETIRGLLVHSAEWSPAMLETFLSGSNKSNYSNLLRTCGYGIPDFDRATRCMNNRLTLVSESELQPFHKTPSGTYATNELHIYQLPWPKAELENLGEVPVRLRVTLSYFIEPGPGEVGWGNRYRYPSHCFRFDINSPSESLSEFKARVNKQARDEENDGRTKSPSGHWRIGQQRDVGSIHSDDWSGTAADLAACNMLAVRPAIGWWRERPHLGCWARKARYSLIVSISSPVEEVDLYTPVLAQIAQPVPVVIEAVDSHTE